MAANDILARNLRRFREERKLSLAELGRRSGLSKQTVLLVEAGSGNPTIDTIDRLALALDVSPRALLSEMGTEVLVNRAQEGRWQQQGGADVRQLDQAFGSGYVVNALIRLRSGDEPFLCPARSRGSLRHCYVVDGVVSIGPVAKTVTGRRGDFVRFPADTDHVFETLTETAEVLVCTTAPQLSMAGGVRVF
ncbi:XRE family transcriptional regulator [Microbacterium testaceum]|uniref:DNA-binding protein n=1 Tax=Microbacterium testaceum TaxID=2033 RepID=A0A2T7WTC1_MICTE|nr:XRE family transcriptional regulator [Microbacterium testaceum]PVE77843.1 DNA-binding protein [Microbacterium testaceum]